MPSVYLQSTDYTNFGVAAGTTSAQITQASSIIDGYTKRQPYGLIWSADYLGNPCYMTSAQPLYTVTATQSIAAGTNVTFTISGPTRGIQTGDVVIIDKATPSLTEACIVQAFTLATNTIVLSKVLQSHSSSALLDFGMTIMEEKNMPQSRPITNLSHWPVENLISGVGQYGYSRRGNTDYDSLGTLNLLSVMTTFGGPPGWEPFDTTIAGLDPLTGRVWAPAGVLLAYYSQIRFWYIAGWTYATLPYAIKQACANIINACLNNPLLGPIKMARAGDTAIERFAATNLDDDTKALLDPYRARVLA